MRDDDCDTAWIGGGRKDRSVAGVEYRLFEEEDAAITGAAAEEMLRALENEVPTQVGEADDIV